MRSAYTSSNGRAAPPIVTVRGSAALAASISAITASKRGIGRGSRIVLRRSADLDVFPESDPVVDLLHRGARCLVGPRRPRTARGAARDVVELDAVRAFQILRRLRGSLQQIHADRLPWKISIAAHFEGLIAVRDHLAAPNRLHGTLLHRVRTPYRAPYSHAIGLIQPAARVAASVRSTIAGARPT